jgi:hypothetical protein
MKQRPILFSKPMVFAIMDGIKTQTRRVVKPQPDEYAAMQGDQCMLVHDSSPDMHNSELIACPYGKPGDQLWVKETVWVDADTKEFKWYAHQRIFKVDRVRDNARLWPSIHMKRAWSRIQLEITGVRVERLQDISEDDAKAEGVESDHTEFEMIYWVEGVTGYKLSERYAASAKEAYQRLWESINGEGSWDANPWVWIVEFKVLEP